MLVAFPSRMEWYDVQVKAGRTYLPSARSQPNDADDYDDAQQWRLKAKLAKRDEAANGECGIDHGSARSTASVREKRRLVRTVDKK